MLTDPCPHCSHNYPRCPTHVRCDESCGALNAPTTRADLFKALAHWRDHQFLGGCSHGQ